MATLQNIGKLKYRGKDGQWHPLPVVVQDAGGGVSTISGNGAPTSETQGKLNQLYRDEDTQKLYICTATDGGYTWAAVSGGSVDVDATLTKAGQAADAKATGDAIGKKLDKAQGTVNAGKILGIGADGNVTPQDKPVQALAGASAPTTATAGVVGQEYYVIANGEVTEMYVCTAVANGTYTWDLVEFGAEETDPTVPSWAKAAQKPSYTASEVGADPSGTAASQVSAHNTGTDTHSDIRLLISGLTDRLNALADSDDTTLDQLSEVVAYIKSNKALIDAVTTGKVSTSDIVDNLTTNASGKVLSAAQGVALKAMIDGIVIPTALPNPNALTLTGAVNETYDGSAPKSVAIPTVPEALKNPNKLTFMGAVTAEYDGSSEVSVEIPAGGGSAYELPIASPTTLGGVMPSAKTDGMTQAVGVDEAGGLWSIAGGSEGEWVEVGTVTLDEDINVWNLDVSSVNPNYSSFDELRIEFVFLGTSSNTKENNAYIRARLNNANSGSNATIKYASRISGNLSTLVYIEKSGGTLDTFITISNSGLSTSYVSGCHSKKITGFNAYCNNGSYIAAGSTAKIIGRGA